MYPLTSSHPKNGGAVKPPCSAAPSNLEKLFGQPEIHCDVQLHGYRLFIQICWLVLPLSYRVYCSLNQQRRSRCDFHLRDVSLFVEDCLNHHHTLRMHLFCECWVYGFDPINKPRLLYAATYAHRRRGFGLPRCGRR
jgi:hypothetical protein